MGGIRYILAGFLEIKSKTDGKTCKELMERPEIIITNHLETAVELFWTNPSGADVSNGILYPNEWTSQNTHVSHHFYVRLYQPESVYDFFIEDAKRKYYDIWDTDDAVTKKKKCECDDLMKQIKELKREIAKLMESNKKSFMSNLRRSLLNDEEIFLNNDEW